MEPDKYDAIAGRTPEALADTLLRSWQSKVFLGAFVIAAGSTALLGSVSQDTLAFFAGAIATAGTMLTFLLVRDLYVWWDRGSYNREQSYHFHARLYGIGYEKLHIIGYLRSDGAMVIMRKVTVKAFSGRWEKIDHYLFAREAPETERTITAVIASNQRGTDQGTKVTLEQVSASHDEFRGQVLFEPPLKRNTVVEYEVTETVPPQSFALTLDELSRRKMNYEFLAWDITRPTKELIITIILSPETPVKEASPDAWFGRSELSRWVERENIRRQWQDLTTAVPPKLEVKISRPILGFTYCIRWLPAR